MIGGALFFYKTIQPPWRARENHTTAPLARGNAPLLPPAAASSPEGQICSMLSLVLTLVAHWIAPLELPPPGEVPPKAGIGVHFHRAPARFACFPFTRQGGCKGFIIRGAHLFLKAPTTTLGPEGRCPPLLHNPPTQPAAKPRPFFIPDTSILLIRLYDQRGERAWRRSFQILRCTIHGSGEERNGAFMNFTSPARRKLHKNS